MPAVHDAVADGALTITNFVTITDYFAITDYLTITDYLAITDLFLAIIKLLIILNFSGTS